MPPQSLKTAAARQTPALPKVDDGKIDFDTIEALFFAYRDFVSDPTSFCPNWNMGGRITGWSISSAGSRA